ncbi:MAG: cyclic nucleotide-binding domain-containing protein [Actinobacteria bacterium]|nr:MAG: cyclic nucleotide-binding domain-containing protein [Actinomycetota bacterium]
MRVGKNTKIELIRHVPLFSRLSKNGLNEVASIADEIDLPQGKELTREGERGREFFVILEGSADVVKKGNRVAQLGEGDFLGEIALVTKQPRTATVTTTTPVRVLVITDRDFRRLLNDSPSIGQGVLEALAERLAPELS